MKKTLIISLGSALIAFSACKKDNTNTPSVSFTELEGKVLTDFTNVLANPTYQDIQQNAKTLNDAVLALQANKTDENLAEVRAAWKNTRAAWEQCESFLFGPVEDNDYDPKMDTWPVNKVSLDSVLASNNSLDLNDIEQLDYSLKGFHAMEYIVFGVGGNRKASQLSSREMKYLTSLSQNLYNITTQLASSWDVAHEDFSSEVINAGEGSTTFSSRQAAFTTIVGAMAGICDEVANEKMQTPFEAQDSTLDESSFSHNSVSDFKNNIIGIQNVYFSKYKNSGTGLNQLVAARNKSLDQTIQAQLTTAINSFDKITVSYEEAIYSQRAQIKASQDAINALKKTLEEDLANFIQVYIKD